MDSYLYSIWMSTSAITNMTLNDLDPKVDCTLYRWTRKFICDSWRSCELTYVLWNGGMASAGLRWVLLMLQH